MVIIFRFQEVLKNRFIKLWSSIVFLFKRFSFWSCLNIWKFISYCLRVFIFQRYSPQIFRKIINKHKYISISFIVWSLVVNHISEINTPDFINMVIDYLISRIISLWRFAIKFIKKFLILAFFDIYFQKIFFFYLL